MAKATSVFWGGLFGVAVSEGFCRINHFSVFNSKSQWDMFFLSCIPHFFEAPAVRLVNTEKYF
jgi:hypothetical protein